MANTAKIAISLPKELLLQCDQMAQELRETRSALIQAALSVMVEEYQQQKALSAAKEIYAQIADSDLKLNEAFLSISAETVLSNSKGDEHEKTETG
jgi:metal-responsive CopG/Arc/MetJ family transcriptional regulator